MPGRVTPFQTSVDGMSDGSGSYRYGFNGKENDFEPKNSQGSQQDYGMRIYDPRLGRFLIVDPLSPEYPWYTPYQFAGNKPIIATDLDGLEENYVFILTTKSAGTQVATLNYKQILELAGKPGKMGNGTLIVNYNAVTDKLSLTYIPTFWEKIKGYKLPDIVVWGDQKDNSKNTGEKIKNNKRPTIYITLSEVMEIVGIVTSTNKNAIDKLKKRSVETTGKEAYENAKKTAETVDEVSKPDLILYDRTKSGAKGDSAIQFYYIDGERFETRINSERADKLIEQGQAIETNTKPPKKETKK